MVFFFSRVLLLQEKPAIRRRYSHLSRAGSRTHARTHTHTHMHTCTGLEVYPGTDKPLTIDHLIEIGKNSFNKSSTQVSDPAVFITPTAATNTLFA